MPRTINTTAQAALESTQVGLGIFVALTLPSGAVYIWSGMGNIVVSGNTYVGVGVLGAVSTVGEATSVFANGVQLTLEGVDATTISEALTDIPVGSYCEIFLGVVQGGAVVGALIPIFVGYTDQVGISESAHGCTVTIDVESKLAQLQRNREYRYTDQQQRALYPSDAGLKYVSTLQNWMGTWGFRNNND
jgi:hypothetical protein